MKASEIKKLNYSQFVGFIKERNRPSGGLRTVQNVAVNAFVNNTSKMLEIGSNTGFTSVNMNLLTGCEVVGIDPEENSVKEAMAYAKALGASRVEFKLANALSLPFRDSSFDIVWCSNVTSFIAEKGTAVNEYMRVLKPGGYIAAIPIYYRCKPPQKLVDEVSEAIASTIEVWDKQHWVNLYQSIAAKTEYALELVYDEDFEYLERGPALNEYIKELMSKAHLRSMREDEKLALEEKARYFFDLFNKNLGYAGYSILIFQKRAFLDETEFFISKKV